MKTKRVLRYYCEFCKKSGCGKFHILKHERVCTNNPNRACGFCVHIRYDDSDYKVPTTSKLLAIFSEKGYSAMRKRCQACPACTLAVLRQSKALANYKPDEDGGAPRADWADFDFKTEARQFWEDRKPIP